MSLGPIQDTGPLLHALAVLLTNKDWRQRVVEKMVPLSPDHYELRRSFQFEIPSDYLLALESSTPTDILLPICWMPKHALLDFDVADETGRPLHVLERRSIGGAVSQVLDAWKSDIASLAVVDLSQETLESSCVASLDPWEIARSRALDRGVTEVDALCSYLNELMPFRVAPVDVETAFNQGLVLTQELYRTLERDSYQDERFNTLSIGAVLAPYLKDGPKSASHLKTVVEAHQAAVEALRSAAISDDAALGWMALAVEAGVRWPLLVRTRVNPGVPFLVKVREVRDSGRTQDPKVFIHRADLASARSYHLQVRSPDHSVWIPTEPMATTASGTTRGALDLFENSVLTEELFATYTSLDPRPDWVGFEVHFRLRWHHAIGYWYALALVMTALWFAIFNEVDGQLAAVLTIPTTLVSAFLLARDTPLGARYLQVWRAVLALASVSLWVVVGMRYLNGLAEAAKGLQ